MLVAVLVMDCVGETLGVTVIVRELVAVMVIVSVDVSVTDSVIVGVAVSVRVTVRVYESTMEIRVLSGVLTGEDGVCFPHADMDNNTADKTKSKAVFFTNVSMNVLFRYIVSGISDEKTTQPSSGIVTWPDEAGMVAETQTYAGADFIFSSTASPGITRVSVDDV